MAPLADFLTTYLPLPNVPYHYTHYVNGKTPLSTTPEVIAALVGYLVLVFGIREYMKDKQPIKLNILFQLHNVLLSAGSLLLLLLMVEEVAPIAWKHGLFHAMCNDNSWTRVRPLNACVRTSLMRCHTSTALGILLHDQLLLQVLGACRYRFPRAEEETSWYATKLYYVAPV
jgi:hypothetical protein